MSESPSEARFTYDFTSRPVVGRLPGAAFQPPLEAPSAPGVNPGTPLHCARSLPLGPEYHQAEPLDPIRPEIIRVKGPRRRQREEAMLAAMLEGNAPENQVGGRRMHVVLPDGRFADEDGPLNHKPPPIRAGAGQGPRKPRTHHHLRSRL